MFYGLMPQPCARKRMSICSFGSRRGYRCLLMASYFSAIPAPCSLLPPLLSISAISLPLSLFRYCYATAILPTYLLPLLTHHVSILRYCYLATTISLPLLLSCRHIPLAFVNPPPIIRYTLSRLSFLCLSLFRYSAQRVPAWIS